MSYGNPNIYRWDWSSKLIIGNFCSIGPNVSFFIGGDHRTDWITTSPLPASQFSKYFKNASRINNFTKSKEGITIEHDVWIGGNSLILSGVKIGTGAVIAAGSVVTKDVEPFAIFGGNPAKFIKKRFSEDIIKKILESKWWMLDDQIIDQNLPFLLSGNFDQFFEKIKNIKKLIEI